MLTTATVFDLLVLVDVLATTAFPLDFLVVFTVFLVLFWVSLVLLAVTLVVLLVFAVLLTLVVCVSLASA